MDAQWNHCSRTYCNKNFRGWIAGFNPFCQLIEIRTLGYPRILATGSYSPLTGINTPKLDHQQLFPKRKIMYHGNDDKYGAARGKFGLLCGHQRWRRQFQRDASRTHWRSSDLGGCPWLVLACLGLSCLCCLVGRPNPKKNFQDLFFFFPPPPLQPNTTPKWIGKTPTVWTP